MKKLTLFLLILYSALIFSGCEIHFADGASYEVPWWFAALLFNVPFLIFGAILIYINCPKEFWAYCPKCESRFYVKKRVPSFTLHSSDYFDFYYKCPCCGQKSICSISYDQDD